MNSSYSECTKRELSNAEADHLDLPHSTVWVVGPAYSNAGVGACALGEEARRTDHEYPELDCPAPFSRKQTAARNATNDEHARGRAIIVKSERQERHAMKLDMDAKKKPTPQCIPRKFETCDKEYEESVNCLQECQQAAWNQLMHYNLTVSTRICIYEGEDDPFPAHVSDLMRDYHQRHFPNPEKLAHYPSNFILTYDRNPRVLLCTRDEMMANQLESDLTVMAPERRFRDDYIFTVLACPACVNGQREGCLLCQCVHHLFLSAPLREHGGAVTCARALPCAPIPNTYSPSPYYVLSRTPPLNLPISYAERIQIIYTIMIETGTMVPDMINEVLIETGWREESTFDWRYEIARHMCRERGYPFWCDRFPEGYEYKSPTVVLNVDQDYASVSLEWQNRRVQGKSLMVGAKPKHDTRSIIRQCKRAFEVLYGGDLNFVDPTDPTDRHSCALTAIRIWTGDETLVGRDQLRAKYGLSFLDVPEHGNMNWEAIAAAHNALQGKQVPCGKDMLTYQLRGGKWHMISTGQWHDREGGVSESIALFESAQTTHVCLAVWLRPSGSDAGDDSDSSSTAPSASQSASSDIIGLFGLGADRKGKGRQEGPPQPATANAGPSRAAAPQAPPASQPQPPPPPPIAPGATTPQGVTPGPSAPPPPPSMPLPHLDVSQFTGAPWATTMNLQNRLPRLKTYDNCFPVTTIAPFDGSRFTSVESGCAMYVDGYGVKLMLNSDVALQSHGYVIVFHREYITYYAHISIVPSGQPVCVVPMQQQTVVDVSTVTYIRWQFGNGQQIVPTCAVQYALSNMVGFQCQSWIVSENDRKLLAYLQHPVFQHPFGATPVSMCASVRSTAHSCGQTFMVPHMAAEAQVLRDMQPHWNAAQSMLPEQPFQFLPFLRACLQGDHAALARQVYSNPNRAQVQRINLLVVVVILVAILYLLKRPKTMLHIVKLMLRGSTFVESSGFVGIVVAPLLEEVAKRSKARPLGLTPLQLIVLFEGTRAACAGQALNYIPTALMHWVCSKMSLKAGTFIHSAWNAYICAGRDFLSAIPECESTKAAYEQAVAAESNSPAGKFARVNVAVQEKCVQFVESMSRPFTKFRPRNVAFALFGHPPDQPSVFVGQWPTDDVDSLLEAQARLRKLKTRKPRCACPQRGGCALCVGHPNQCSSCSRPVLRNSPCVCQQASVVQFMADNATSSVVGNFYAPEVAPYCNASRSAKYDVTPLATNAVLKLPRLPVPPNPRLNKGLCCCGWSTPSNIPFRVRNDQAAMEASLRLRALARTEDENGTEIAVDPTAYVEHRVLMDDGGMEVMYGKRKRLPRAPFLVWNKRFTTAKQRKHCNTMQATLDSQIDPYDASHHVTIGHVKVESLQKKIHVTSSLNSRYFLPFKPRSIGAKKDIANVMLGPRVLASSAYLKRLWNTESTIAWAAGMNANDIGRWFRRAIQSCDGVWLEDDFELYDKSQNGYSFENNRRVLKHHGMTKSRDRAAAYAFDQQTKGVTGRSRCGFRWSIPGTLSSGVPNTSYSGTGNNVEAHYYAFSKVFRLTYRQIRERIWVIALGDDIAAYVPRELYFEGCIPLIEEQIRRWGFKPKMKVATSSEVEFCAGRPIPIDGSMILAPKLGRLLPKFCWSVIEPPCYGTWLADKLSSFSGVAACTPFFRVWHRWMVEQLTNGTPRFEMAGKYFEATGAYSESSMACFERVYGLGSTDEQALALFLKGKKINSVLNHYTLDVMVKRDL